MEPPMLAGFRCFFLHVFAGTPRNLKNLSTARSKSLFIWPGAVTTLNPLRTLAPKSRIGDPVVSHHSDGTFAQSCIFIAFSIVNGLFNRSWQSLCSRDVAKSNREIFCYCKNQRDVFCVAIARINEMYWYCKNLRDVLLLQESTRCFAI